MNRLSPSKTILGAFLTLIMLTTPANAFTIISFNANGSATDATFGFPIGNVGQNYAEMQGFRLGGDWEFEDMQQVGFSMCTNGGSESFYARILQGTTILATSTAVSETVMPNCAGYASTTANPDVYTYFTFSEPRTFVSGQTIMVSNTGDGSSNIGFYATSSASASIFESANCYGVNGTSVIGACIYGTFTLPYLAINDSTSVDIGTRIISVDSPLNATLQPTVEVPFTFDFFFNDIDFGKYNYVSGELNDLTTGLSLILPKKYISLSGSDTYDFTVTLEEEHFYMWRPFIHATGSSTANIYGNNAFFDVVNYSGEFTPFPTPDATSTITELTLECSDEVVTGSICKVFGYLFVPPADTLDKFSNIWQRIQTKRPFGYVTATIDQLGNLDVSGSSAFDLGEIPFMDSVFTPFRTLVSGILWALFAIYFYQRRLIHLDI